MIIVRLCDYKKKRKVVLPKNCSFCPNFSNLWTTGCAAAPSLPTFYAYDNKNYTPLPNNDPIAPDAIIEMVSSYSCKICNTGRCRCPQEKQICIDFCGCSEYCENTDIPMPETIKNDEEDKNTEEDA